MSVTKEEILDTIANMSVMEVVELIGSMEEKFGVSAASAAVAVPAAAEGAEAEAQPEQTEFDAVLSGFGSSKVAVIKVVRTLTSLTLKEAKDMVESTPSVIKEAVSREEAEEIKKKIEEAGGSVEVK